MHDCFLYIQDLRLHNPSWPYYLLLACFTHIVPLLFFPHIVAPHSLAVTHWDPKHISEMSIFKRDTVYYVWNTYSYLPETSSTL